MTQATGVKSVISNCLHNHTYLRGVWKHRWLDPKGKLPRLPQGQEL